MQEKDGYIEPEDFENGYAVPLSTAGTAAVFESGRPLGTGSGLSERGVENFVLPVESLVARMGAKSQLRDWLVTNFPPSYAYVEPFGGSFKVLLWKPNRSAVEVINDVDGDLVHFFRYVAFDPERLAAAINAVPTHEALVLGFRSGLAARELRGLERAVATYVSFAASFNGMVGRYAGSAQSLIDISVDARKVQKVAKRLQGVDIRATAYHRIIDTYNKALSAEAYPPGGVFFYLDPPYWATTGYQTHAGQSGFGWSDQERLANYCWDIDQMGNKFIQTNSYHEDLLKLYGGFKRADGSPAFYMEDREVYYSVAGKGDVRKEAKEIIISNFPLRKQRDANKRQGGLFG